MESPEWFNVKNGELIEMSKYLLIESRDPFEVREVANDYTLAADLAKAGNDIVLFLVQNGVLPARKAARDCGLQSVLASGVKIVCDQFSLRERGITSEAIADGYETGPMDIVVDYLADGAKTLWL
jgi:predicted peroxiredoxin